MARVFKQDKIDQVPLSFSLLRVVLDVVAPKGNDGMRLPVSERSNLYALPHCDNYLRRPQLLFLFFVLQKTIYPTTIQIV